MSSKDPEKLRLKGESLREKENYVEALKVLDEALLSAQSQKNYEVMVDVLKDSCLT